jgi:hypothetical protein
LRLSTVVPALAVAGGAVLAVLAGIAERSVSDHDPPDPRGIPSCPAGAEQDLLGARALRCWLEAPRGRWRTLSRAHAYRALVVKAEASDVRDAEEIARRWVADVGDEFSEIAVYVQREPAPRPTRIRRVAWTHAGGFQTIEFVGRLTP